MQLLQSRRMDPWARGLSLPRWPVASVLTCALLALAPCALAGPAAPPTNDAHAETYRLDPVHTRVLFAISHAGFSQALGTVSGSTGTLVFDPGDWSSARISVSVPVARLDLSDAGWNRAAGGQGLLDVHAWPVATFVSQRVQAVDPTHASVCGTLTLHGVARDTCLQVTFNQLQRLTLPPFHRVAGFSATATLSRKAFGITAWPTLVGDTVQLRIEAEAVRDNSQAPSTPPPPPTPAPMPASMPATSTPVPSEAPPPPPPATTP